MKYRLCCLLFNTELSPPWSDLCLVLICCDGSAGRNLLRIAAIITVLLHPRANLSACIKVRDFLEEGSHQCNWAGKQHLCRVAKGLMKVKNRTNLLLPPRLEIRETVLTLDVITWAESTVVTYTQVFVHMHMLFYILLLGSKISLCPTNAFGSLFC